MDSLLVFGASRGIGLRVVKEALLQGYHVKAFSRSAQDMDFEDQNLSKIAGDALSRDDVKAALQDVQAVIQVLGVPINKALLTGPIDLFSKATEILVKEMQRKGVRRFIAVTGYGAGHSKQTIGPLQRIGYEAVFKYAYGDKDKQEKIIEEADLDWTIVRPGILTNGPKTGCYKVYVCPKDWRNGIISRADVAQYLVKVLPKEETFCTTPVIQTVPFLKI